jgi:hypothetical protein
MIEHAVRERFVKPEYADLVFFAATPVELLDRLTVLRAPEALQA